MLSCKGWHERKTWWKHKNFVYWIFCLFGRNRVVLEGWANDSPRDGNNKTVEGEEFNGVNNRRGGGGYIWSVYVFFFFFDLVDTDSYTGMCFLCSLPSHLGNCPVSDVLNDNMFVSYTGCVKLWQRNPGIKIFWKCISLRDPSSKPNKNQTKLEFGSC